MCLLPVSCVFTGEQFLLMCGLSEGRCTGLNAVHGLVGSGSL